MVQLGLGNVDQALTWLEKACSERALQMIALKVAPLYDPLRSDPRFDQLIARIGLSGDSTTP